VGASLVILLYRIAKPRGDFLGRVKLQALDGTTASPLEERNVYLPIALKNENPKVHVEDAPPGILIYRFEESFTFPNASVLNDRIVDYAKLKTKRGRATQYKKLGDRPWNEGYVPRSMTKILHLNEHDTRPILRAVVYDFGAVSNIDSTGIQSLVDTRQQLDRYSDRQVEYHFASIRSPWIKRALVAGGFGTGSPAHRVVEVASVVPIEGAEGPDVHGEEEYQRRRRKSMKDIEQGESEVSIVQDIPTGGRSIGSSNGKSSEDTDVVPVVETNYPFFHLDLDDAVKSAERVPLE